MTFSFPQIFELLLIYKYYILLPVSVLEGPIITIIAAFLAGQGYMNVYVVYVLVVIGDVLGDMLYYALGRYGGRKFIDRFGKYLGFDEKKVEEWEVLFHSNKRKTLVVGKFTHALGSVVLVAAGAARLPFGEFILFNFLPTLPKSFVFVLVGYFFGQAYAQIDKYITYGSYILAAVLIALICAYLIYKKYKKTGS